MQSESRVATLNCNTGEIEGGLWWGQYPIKRGAYLVSSLVDRTRPKTLPKENDVNRSGMQQGRQVARHIKLQHGRDRERASRGQYPI